MKFISKSGRRSTVDPLLTENIVLIHAKKVSDHHWAVCAGRRRMNVAFATQGIDVQSSVYPTYLGLWVREKRRSDMRERDTGPCMNLNNRE